MDGRVVHEVRTFGTSTRELGEMADWLSAAGCTHVAMESTGVYWKPVWHVLEGRFELVLANAMYVRNIPGRKSDVKDAVWIADLLAHGLLRGSFVPPERIQELRDLTRTRKQLVREITRHTQRIQKTLEDANVKLTEVITDIVGTSGRAILRALIAGETDLDRLVDLTSGRLKAPRATPRTPYRAGSPSITASCSRCIWSSSSTSKRPSAKWRRGPISSPFEPPSNC
jgi:hypothetical protein